MIPTLGRTDIYLIDQIMKGRIQSDMRLLDAGCGSGRNSQYFVQQNMDIWGLDLEAQAIEVIKENVAIWNPTYALSKFSVADLTSIPFPDAHFDFIISSAVLHFSKNRENFIALFEESIRVLKPTGLFWFRMTTKHTLLHVAQHLYDDIYLLPDGSTRYLLDIDLLQFLMQKHQLQFVDPFKTVNVSDLRTMATVVLSRVAG